MKIIRKMTKLDKRKWREMRMRVKKALLDEKSINKRDLNITYQLHRNIYNKPTVRPGINCCIDIATWLEMIKNINAAYTKKVESDGY